MTEEVKAYLELFAKYLQENGGAFDATGIRDFSRNCGLVDLFIKANPPPSPMDPWMATVVVAAVGAFLTLYRK